MPQCTRVWTTKESSKKQHAERGVRQETARTEVRGAKGIIKAQRNMCMTVQMGGGGGGQPMYAYLPASKTQALPPSLNHKATLKSRFPASREKERQPDARALSSCCRSGPGPGGNKSDAKARKHREGHGFRGHLACMVVYFPCGTWELRSIAVLSE